MTAGRELALLTNPTAGKGKGARTAAMALPRLLEAGYDVRSLAGRSPEEAMELARQCVATGSRRWSCAAATAWCTSARRP